MPKFVAFLLPSFAHCTPDHGDLTALAGWLWPRVSCKTRCKASTAPVAASHAPLDTTGLHALLVWEASLGFRLGGALAGLGSQDVSMVHGGKKYLVLKMNNGLRMELRAALGPSEARRMI
eukprot:1154560-Pelagomonas_calceolata.AAC.4